MNKKIIKISKFVSHKICGENNSFVSYILGKTEILFDKFNINLRQICLGIGVINTLIDVTKESPVPFSHYQKNELSTQRLPKKSVLFLLTHLNMLLFSKF